MIKFLNELMNKVIGGHEIDKDEAMSILSVKNEDVPFLLGCTSAIRNRFCGNTLNFCAILNAKSGNCVNDCAYCAQSSYHRASVKTYPLVSADEMLNAAVQAHQINASCFGIVTSGETVSSTAEQEIMVRSISLIKSRYPEMDVSVSIGKITRQFLRQLIDAGLNTVHHNLETSARHYANICTTRSFNEKLDFLNLLKDEKVKVCCGGILGLGETLEDQVDMAFTLRSLRVNRVPLNFLNPIPGTKLENMKQKTPLENLRSIALFRFALPEKHIQVCGGRELNFRSLQPAIFWAGADGMMVGNYLTTAGQDPKADLQIINDLNMTVVSN
ncbi:MAG: biotin synthase BioB [Spirochaetota bacterium]